MKPLLIALSLLSPLAASAGSVSDLVMAAGLFAAAVDGEVLAYEHNREAPAILPQRDIENGRLMMEAKPGPRGRVLALSREEDGQFRPIADFPASGSNPVLLYFLETTARNMAEATGGSPFYIRNRMREALGAAEPGAEGPPQVATLRPFARDPNRGRMGVFGDLTVSLTYDPARPDRILELSADTGAGEDGYHDRLVLIAED